MRHRAILAVFLGTMAPACGLFSPDAPDPTWTSLGLDGETVTALEQTLWGLYAGTASSGVFRYDATAKTWQPSGLANEGAISDLVYVPTVHARVLAAVGPRAGERVDAVVFASADGETWAPSDAGYAQTVEDTPAGYSLAFDPTQPAKVYAGLSRGAMKSMDGGSTWQLIFGDSASRISGYVASVFVEGAGIIWLARNYTISTEGTTGGLLYRSADGGATWLSSAPLSANPPLSDIYVARDGTVWLLLTVGVMFSTDNGANWEASLSSVMLDRASGGLGHTTTIVPAGDTLYVVSRLGGSAG